MNRRYILLAEDNANDVMLTRRALGRCGTNMELVVVENGQEALDFVFGRDGRQGPANEPEFVLLDIKLPLVDGLEVLRRIRADPRTRRLPVIILSCSVDDKDRRDGLRLGANAFYSKPVRFDDFVKLMQKLCDDWTAPAAPAELP